MRVPVAISGTEFVIFQVLAVAAAALACCDVS